MTPLEYIDQRIQSLSCGPQDGSTRERAAIIRTLEEVKKLILEDRERMIQDIKSMTLEDPQTCIEYITIDTAISIIKGEDKEMLT